MAITFADGFDHYVGPELPPGVWPSGVDKWEVGVSRRMASDDYELISTRISENKWQVKYLPKGRPAITLTMNHPPAFIVN